MVVDAPSVVIDHSEKSLASQLHTTQLQTYESSAFQVVALVYCNGREDNMMSINSRLSTLPLLHYVFLGRWPGWP